jgi:RNA polymerase sigma-70 factor (ECF subfamily)
LSHHERLKPEQVTDESLALRVAQGDSAALEALYDRYASSVLAVALKIVGDRATAEDLLQETFWRIWRGASTFQPERGSFAGWLFRITRNLAIDAYRRRKTGPQVLLEDGGDDRILDRTPDPDTNIADQIQAAMIHRRVRQALDGLPQEQRQVLELAYFYGMSRQEIASATGQALGTIHTRARLGLQKLRDELEKEEFGKHDG